MTPLYKFANLVKNAINEAFDFNEVGNDTNDSLSNNLSNLIRSKYNLIKVLQNEFGLEKIATFKQTWIPELDTVVAFKSVKNPNNGIVQNIMHKCLTTLGFMQMRCANCSILPWKVIRFVHKYPIIKDKIKVGITSSDTDYNIQPAEIPFMDNFPPVLFSKLVNYYAHDFVAEPEDILTNCTSSIRIAISPDKGIWMMLYNDLIFPGNNLKWGNYNLVFGFTNEKIYEDALNTEEVKNVRKSSTYTSEEKGLKKAIKNAGILLNDNYNPIKCPDGRIAFVSKAENPARKNINGKWIIDLTVRELALRTFKKWMKNNCNFKRNGEDYIGFNPKPLIILDLPDIVPNYISNDVIICLCYHTSVIDNNIDLISFIHISSETKIPLHYITTFDKNQRFE